MWMFSWLTRVLTRHTLNSHGSLGCTYVRSKIYLTRTAKVLTVHRTILMGKDMARTLQVQCSTVQYTVQYSTVCLHCTLKRFYDYSVQDSYQSAMSVLVIFHLNYQLLHHHLIKDFPLLMSSWLLIISNKILFMFYFLFLVVVCSPLHLTLSCHSLMQYISKYFVFWIWYSRITSPVFSSPLFSSLYLSSLLLTFLLSTLIPSHILILIIITRQAP